MTTEKGREKCHSLNKKPTMAGTISHAKTAYHRRGVEQSVPFLKVSTCQELLNSHHGKRYQEVRF